jgi:hypothetical protein
MCRKRHRRVGAFERETLRRQVLRLEELLEPFRRDEIL